MAIRYGFLPRREKQLESLGPEPFLYPSTHPCLAEAMHRSYSSDVWDEERVSELKRRAAEGQICGRYWSRKAFGQTVHASKTGCCPSPSLLAAPA